MSINQKVLDAGLKTSSVSGFLMVNVHVNGRHARRQPARQRDLIVHTATARPLKDASTCGPEEPGIEPPIFRLVDDPLLTLPPEPQPPSCNSHVYNSKVTL